MKREAVVLALGLAVFLSASCGKKGPLQPPVSAAPKPVEGLTARQRAATVILEWANPDRSVDGRPVGDLAAVEVWVFDRGLAAGSKPVRAEDVEKSARLARRVPRPEFAGFRDPAGGPPRRMTFPFAFDPGPAGPKQLAFTVRVFDAKRRASDFAAPVAVALRPCPEPPRKVAARTHHDHIELNWEAHGWNIDGTGAKGVGGYAVYRSDGEGPARRMGRTGSGVTRFEDRDFKFGQAFLYFVRALAPGTDGEVEVESGDSAAVTVEPRDVFPPDAPAGLVAIATQDGISLSWAAGREEDLAGYRVWRKEPESSEFAALTTGLLAANAFTDTTAAKGKLYVYAVSAVDRDGNESPRSECGPVGLKEGGA